MTELEDLEAKLAQAKAARAERQAKAADAKALDDAKRGLADLELLEGYEQEHGEDAVRQIQGRKLTVFVKKPHRNTYDKFAERKNPTAQQVKEFVWPCILGDKNEVDAAIKDEPHLLYRLANAVAELGGVVREESDGKS